jgi:hypothetical protein
MRISYSRSCTSATGGAGGGAAVEGVTGIIAMLFSGTACGFCVVVDDWGGAFCAESSGRSPGQAARRTATATESSARLKAS